VRKQTKLYARWRKPGAIVLVLGLGGLGATYVDELASAQVAPAGDRSARGLSLAADALPGSAQPVARAGLHKGLAGHRAKLQPRSSRPKAPASAPRRKRARTELGPVSREQDVLTGQRDVFTGSLNPRLRGRQVLLQVRQHQRWWTVAHSRTGARSRYELSYQPTAGGTVAVRVLFPGGATSKPTRRRLGLLKIYHLALASWYGGGGYLACGGILTSSTLGVANKTLPCGTMVTLRYGGRSVRVPVVDRGPFVPGREFDLTEATKNALGFDGVGELWASY
jgi:hypothetical protein